MKIRFAAALILLAALSRLLPHPPNFTPIGAMALFGAAYFNRRWLALAIPFGALFLSDLLINNILYREFYPQFTWFTSGWIYGAFALVMLLGLAVLRRRVSAPRLLAGSLGASLLFYLVTNFAVWAQGGMYPPTWEGLMLCYAAGLPFLGNTLAGDLFFTGVLFGTYAWVSNRRRQPAAGF
jgi:hypothetical protein